MENKLDKLFRDKLEQHTVQPSANAWDKVTNSFPKKNNGVVWAWRIAAALALAGFIGWYVFNTTTPEQQLQAGKKTTEEKQEAKIKQDEAEDKTASIRKAGLTIPNRQSDQESMKTNTTFETTAPDQPEIKENIVEDKKQPDVTVAFVEEVREPTLVESVQPKKEKAMVIVYTLAPVEKKQKVETAKTTGIKKVIEFARDVKGGETAGLASVRDWKDNLFSLDDQTKIEKKRITN